MRGRSQALGSRLVRIRRRIDQGMMMNRCKMLTYLQIHRELGIDEGMNLPVRRNGQTDADATLPDWSSGANNEWNSAVSLPGHV